MKILKFSSQACMPCKQLSKVIDELGMDARNRFEDVTAEDDRARFMEFGIRAVPTLIMVDSKGVEIKRATGMMSKDQLTEFMEL